MLLFVSIHISVFVVQVLVVSVNCDRGIVYGLFIRIHVVFDRVYDERSMLLHLLLYCIMLPI